VHAQVAKATGGDDCIIYFTKKSDNDLFLRDFKDSGCRLKNISAFTGNKWLYFLNLIYRGIITGYINKQQQPPVVFNGQCNFGYKISPWIKKDIRQVELIHSLNSFSYIRIPFLPFIAATIMISRKRIYDHRDLYIKTGVPEYYLQRIHYITNAIELPKNLSEKAVDFTVLYSGRGGIEKRVHLVAEIARQVIIENQYIRFEILGDVSEILPPSVYPFIRFYGNESNVKTIAGIYDRASVLLLTSATEGFPMVVIEAMAHGCVVIATPVGDIPLHIKQGENGFLFCNTQDEKLIIEEGKKLILELKNNPALFEKISGAAQKYATLNFDITGFTSSYNEILKY
jgi:glycosyltransferase involved in cell wall biosynthesis